MSRPEMARHPKAYGVADWPARPPDRHPETLRWTERIEAVRRNVELPTVRRCGGCDEMKPLPEFPLDPRSTLGRSHRCKACRAEMTRRWKLERKRRQFRAVLGRSA